jgi:hypothetical protein
VPRLLLFQELSHSQVPNHFEIGYEADAVGGAVALVQMSQPRARKVAALEAESHPAFGKKRTAAEQVSAPLLLPASAAMKNFPSGSGNPI